MSMTAIAARGHVDAVPIVLCISEDKAFINTARVSLGQAGFVVVTSRNSSDALDLTASQEIDAIICDYGLSQVDGISLFERLRKERAGATPPTLIVNETYAAPLLARCIAAGAVGLHAKGESPEMLVERAISMIADDAKRKHVESSALRRAVQGGTDPLTHIASRTHFTRRLSAESAASYRDGNHLSVVVLSVDRYANTAERHGAQLAESLLAQTARLIEGDLRSRDCVGRYSDHAFGLVLPETPLAAATAVASRLRRAIAGVELGDLDHPIAVTMSAGVASRPVGVRATPEELMEQALKNCAAAAHMGGDRVVADSALTGKPIALLMGPPGDEDTSALAARLSRRGLEVRSAATAEEARRVMTDVPAALLCAVHSPLNGDAAELLVWARTKFPSTRRVLVSSGTEPALMLRMVNEAAIDYLVLHPCPEERIDALVNELIYA
jgi:diguanylate cyclase (GGDEF)-like protein